MESPEHATAKAIIGVRPRLLYSSVFVWISITGGRFTAPLLQDAGLSDSQIGACFALATIVSSLCSTITGSIADDHEKKHRGQGRSQILAGGILIGGILFLLQGLHHVWPNQTSFVSSAAWHITVRVLYAASTSLVFPVLDGLTLDYLSTQSNIGQGDKSDFGKERLWGAIWWAITNLAMGPSLDYFGFSILYPYSIFATVAVIVTIYMFARDRLATGKIIIEDGHVVDISNKNVEMEALTTTEESVRSSEDENEQHLPVGLERQKSHLVETDGPKHNRRLSTFAIAGLVCGTSIGAAFMLAMFSLSIGTAVVENLIFLYFEVLGSSYSLMSLTVLLTVICEIGLFAYGPHLLKKYGATKLLLLAGFCYVTRVLGYSIVPEGQPWLVLFFEPLHGVTYACNSLSSVDFVAELMPAGYESSGQGMLSAVRGCGSFLGLVAAGIGDDLVGPRVVYRTLAAVVAAGFTVLALMVSVYQQTDKDAQLLDAANGEITEDEFLPAASREKGELSSSVELVGHTHSS